MKKYFLIFKFEVMSELQYVVNLLVKFIGMIIMLFILFNLWNYLYEDSSGIINGYTSFQMTWYVIITELLWSILVGRTLVNEVSNEVKSGSITYKINKPYNYIIYLLSNHLGLVFIRAIMYVVIAMGLGILFLGSFPKLSIINVLLIILTTIIAVIINTLLLIFIGLFSFFIEDSGPFYWLYSKLLLVMGTIFPIEFFPNYIQVFLKYSPVYVTSYGPAKLFVDFNYKTCSHILIAQIIYLTISYICCSLLYKKGVKNLNVNGG